MHIYIHVAAEDSTRRLQLYNCDVCHLSLGSPVDAILTSPLLGLFAETGGKIYPSAILYFGNSVTSVAMALVFGAEITCRFAESSDCQALSWRALEAIVMFRYVPPVFLIGLRKK